MDVLSLILGVPGIAARRQTEPEGEAQTVLEIEPKADESNNPRNWFAALRQKISTLFERA